MYVSSICHHRWWYVTMVFGQHIIYLCIGIIDGSQAANRAEPLRVEHTRQLILQPMEVSIDQPINQQLIQPGTVLYIRYSCSVCQFNRYLRFTWTTHHHLQ